MPPLHPLWRPFNQPTSDSLGERALTIEHVGSTSVAGLDAKPVIDIDLVLADSSDERDYVPDLVAAGFAFVIREPDWEEHRCFVRRDPRCNVHVFSANAIEPQRHRVFRDWLATNADDRMNGALKRQLATGDWATTMEYNNEKAVLIYEIYERIFEADPHRPHTPQPLGSSRSASAP